MEETALNYTRSVCKNGPAATVTTVSDQDPERRKPGRTSKDFLCGRAHERGELSINERIYLDTNRSDRALSQTQTHLRLVCRHLPCRSASPRMARSRAAPGRQTCDFGGRKTDICM